MILSDFHVHTNFSDGKTAMEDMILSAIEKGMEKIGFSDHSYTSFDDSYCIKKDDIETYKNMVLSLRKKYKGKIEILLGIEQDFYADFSTDGYDYSIGSVHYIKCGENYIPIDDSEETSKKAIDKYFDGDMYAFAEAYFDTVSKVVEKTECDIIGHFDLVSKFGFFDENNERYVRAYEKALDKLVKSGKPFEINTGAISRGYKKVTYPNEKQLEYISKNGGKVILSSDSHHSKTLMFEFEKWADIAKEKGLETVSL